jgi:hypothetical protein
LSHPDYDIDDVLFVYIMPLFYRSPTAFDALDVSIGDRTGQTPSLTPIQKHKSGGCCSEGSGLGGSTQKSSLSYQGMDAIQPSSQNPESAGVGVVAGTLRDELSGTLLWMQQQFDGNGGQSGGNEGLTCVDEHKTAAGACSVSGLGVIPETPLPNSRFESLVEQHVQRMSQENKVQ